MHAASMENYVGGIEPNADYSDICPDCGGIKSRRAKQCRQCTCERIGRERVARNKAKAQVARLLEIYHERQNAKAVIDAALAGFGRELERAERKVRG